MIQFIKIKCCHSTLPESLSWNFSNWFHSSSDDVNSVIKRNFHFHNSLESTFFSTAFPIIHNFFNTVDRCISQAYWCLIISLSLRRALPPQGLDADRGASAWFNQLPKYVAIIFIRCSIYSVDVCYLQWAMYSMCDAVVYAVSVTGVWIVVALKRAVCRCGHALGLHSRRGSVIVRRRGPQRRRTGGVPGGVYDRSGRSSLVWVERSSFFGASIWV